MLSNVDAWLKKAEEFAAERKFEANAFVDCKLAADMYPLVKQVQAICDSAKFTAARLSGKAAPSHPDTERTMEELHARLAVTIAYLDTFVEADFVGAADRLITLPWMPGKAAKATDYLVEMAIPNFTFHVTTAYGILRASGVPLGKYDYIGGITLQDA